MSNRKTYRHIIFKNDYKRSTSTTSRINVATLTELFEDYISYDPLNIELPEGNIDFYGKSGFRPARDFGIRYHGLPEGEDASFFLCKELESGYLDGITGEYATPKGYFVDEKQAEEFDKQFPPKEKLTLPGQLF